MKRGEQGVPRSSEPEDDHRRGGAEIAKQVSASDRYIGCVARRGCDTTATIHQAVASVARVRRLAGSEFWSQ